MPTIDSIREALPDAAKDLKLNLQAVLRPENLTTDQVWGAALASAFFIGHADLTKALLSDAAEAGIAEPVIDDARASASLMGMNTVFYRFRHLLEKENYASVPARLRMTRMAQPKTDKTTFELMSMACAALAGCGLCIQSHEATLLQHGITEAGITDVIRIAAVLQGTAIALTIP